MSILLGGSKVSTSDAPAGSPATFVMTPQVDTGYDRGLFGSISPDLTIAGSRVDAIVYNNTAERLTLGMPGGGDTNLTLVTSITIGSNVYLTADAENTGSGLNPDVWFWDLPGEPSPIVGTDPINIQIHFPE